MGVSIKITDSSGRSYPDMASALGSAVDEVKDEMWTDAERAAQRETCPVHNKKAAVRRTRSGLNVEACCEQAAERVQAAALRAM